MQDLLLYVCVEPSHLTRVYYQQYKKIVCVGPYQRNLDNSTPCTLTASKTFYADGPFVCQRVRGSLVKMDDDCM